MVGFPVGPDDTVMGGHGNDTLDALTGDILHGGAGRDVFRTFAGYAVTVADFTHGKDQLQIFAPQGAELTLQVQGTGDTVLLVDGVETVVLQGLTPAQFDLADVFIL